MASETWAVIPRLALESEAMTPERKASLLSAAGYRGAERFTNEAEARKRASELAKKLEAPGLRWRVDVWAPNDEDTLADRKLVHPYGDGEGGS